MHICGKKELEREAKQKEEGAKGGEERAPTPGMIWSSCPKVLSLREQEGLGFAVVAATPPNQQSKAGGCAGVGLRVGWDLPYSREMVADR